MKFDSPSRFTSFYESFSDLIFATLVIFVLIIMVLALQINPKIEDYDVVSPNRFTGGHGGTELYVSQAVLDGKDAFIFFPAGVARDFSLYRQDSQRQANSNNPVLNLCAEALKDQGALPRFSIDDMKKLAKGMSRQLIQTNISMGEGTSAAYILVEERRRRGGQFSDTNADRLRDRVFGNNAIRVRTTSLPSTARSAESRISKAIIDRRESRNSVDYYHRIFNAHRRGIQNEAPKHPEGGAVIRFAAPSPGTIRVGDLEITAAQFRGILRSIKPGDNFHVEYIDPDSEEPTAPPDWVMKEVLEPLKIDRRLVDNTASAENAP
ncbi:MAG: hypothetical protein AAF797_05165 [Planctomycetota bacterium]